MKFETVIGLEVHVQIKTRSKIFCGCETGFGASPNANTCPICTGMPGVLPVLNRAAVDAIIRTGLAMNCEISPISRFARKNYFYPDLPKGYQISQYELPVCKNGFVNIHRDGEHAKVNLERIHLEEDAGKLIHGENLGHPEKSYVDLNRTGMPLMEIVSRPDIRSPEEAKEYLTRLKAILEYLDVSDCNMEEGSLRVDANISLRPAGSDKLGTKAEVKNMNSFRFLQKALEFEIARQTELLESGERVIQETRLWDASKGVTISMRSKEEAHDYRYFPDPDLVPLEISREWIDRMQTTLPELPFARMQRFVKQYGIPEYDAEVLTNSADIADYYEKTAALAGNPKIVSNWVMGDVLRVINERNLSLREFKVTAEFLADMVKLIDNGTISGKIAKTVFDEMAETGKPPAQVVEEKGLVQITDESAVAKIIDEIMAENPDNVASYRGGKVKLMGFFVGQVMKKSQGKANPAVVNKLLLEKLGPVQQ